MLAHVKFKKGSYQDALDLLDAFSEDHVSEDFYFFNGHIEFLRGRIFVKLKKYAEAKKSFEKALSYYGKVENKWKFYQTKLELIKINNKINHNAIDPNDIEKFISDTDDLFDNKALCVLSMNELASFYEKKGDIQKADELFNEIFSFSDKILKIQLSHAYYKYYKFCMRQNMKEKAEFYLKTAEELSEKYIRWKKKLITF